MVSKADNRELIFWHSKGQMLIIVCNQVPNFEIVGVGSTDACLLPEGI